MSEVNTGKIVGGIIIFLIIVTIIVTIVLVVTTSSNKTCNNMTDEKCGTGKRAKSSNTSCKKCDTSDCCEDDPNYIKPNNCETITCGEGFQKIDPSTCSSECDQSKCCQDVDETKQALLGSEDIDSLTNYPQQCETDFNNYYKYFLENDPMINNLQIFPFGAIVQLISYSDLDPRRLYRTGDSGSPVKAASMEGSEDFINRECTNNITWNDFHWQVRRITYNLNKSHRGAGNDVRFCGDPETDSNYLRIDNDSGKIIHSGKKDYGDTTNFLIVSSQIENANSQNMNILCRNKNPENLPAELSSSKFVLAFNSSGQPIAKAKVENEYSQMGVRLISYWYNILKYDTEARFQSNCCIRLYSYSGKGYVGFNANNNLQIIPKGNDDTDDKTIWFNARGTETNGSMKLFPLNSIYQGIQWNTSKKLYDVNGVVDLSKGSEGSKDIQSFYIMSGSKSKEFKDIRLSNPNDVKLVGSDFVSNFSEPNTHYSDGFLAFNSDGLLHSPTSKGAKWEDPNTLFAIEYVNLYIVSTGTSGANVKSFT